MTVINPYSKFGSLIIGKEVTAGAAVKPSISMELLSEDIVVSINRQPVQPIAGKVDMRLRSVKDKIEVAGSVTVTIDPKNVGYILTNFFGVPTTKTLQAGKVFEHSFVMSSLAASYTFDIKPADDTLVNRYIGVQVSELAISQSDNKMQLVMTITALKAFTQSRITQATASATQFHVDQTSGLTTSDVVEFRDRADPSNVNGTASVSSITSETILVVGTSQTVSDKDIVTIRKSPVNFTLSKDLIWIGGASYGDGTDINNAETVNDTEDATWSLKRDVEARHSAKGKNFADRFARKLFLKGLLADGTIQHIYESPKFSDKMREGEPVALRTRICGQQIDTNSAQAANLLIGTGAAANAVRCTASVASETSSNLNVRIINNNGDTLVATKEGNNIVVKRADTDTTKNTATLVASAINALSGVTSAADGAGTGETALFARTNFGSGSNLAGRNQNEVEQLRIDLPNTKFQPFGQNLNEDDLIQEEITFDAEYDTFSANTVKMVLTNDISTYA